jgi:hypothetical protein
MGSEVVYCYKCQRRLTASDFQAGAALQVGSLTTCEACADALLGRLTPEQQRAVLKKRAQAMEAAGVAADDAETPSAAPPATHRKPPPPPTQSHAGPARPGGKPPTALILGAAAIVVAVLLLLVLSSGGPSAPSAPAPGPAAVRPPATPRAAAGTELEPPPTPKPEAPEGPPPAALKQELEELEKEVQAASQQQEFRKALDLLERARPRRTDPAWTAAVDARRTALEESIRRYYGWVKAQALEAQRNAISSEVARWRDEVARWGLPSYVGELDKALTAAGKPLPLSEAEGAALRQQLDRLSLFVLPDATSRAMTRLKAWGVQPTPLAWERVVDAGSFTPAACPVVIYAGGEPYRPTVKSPRDVPEALIRYVRAGGTLAVFSSGPWPFYCDEQGMPIANDMAPLLPLSGSWDAPPAGTTVSFCVTDPRALPHVPSTFRFPPDGDRRWRPIQPGQAKGGTRVTTLLELRDGTGRSLGAGAAWMQTGQGRVLNAWFRLLDLPEGDALFHDLWQAIATK